MNPHWEKRQKQSSHEIKKDGEDNISKLPDAILSIILSLIPEADANRTRILSNRWKYLWVFLPYLHFVMPTEQVNKFQDFVDQTLALRNGMPIQRFFLKCCMECDYGRVYEWIRTVVRCKLQKLEVSLPANGYRVWFFCDDLFKTYNTLVELTLEGKIVLDVPLAEWIFPCLKKLNLLSICYSSDESFENLISGCPRIEELCLERHRLCVFYSDDKLKKIKVSSTSLKRLKISFDMFYEDSKPVYIDAPKLEYVYIEDDLTADYYIEEPLSLIEAHIGCHSRSVCDLVRCFSSAKILTMTYYTTEWLYVFFVHNIPMFPNLVRLLIDIRYPSFIPILLKNMPNLENITFMNGLLSDDCMSWNPPENAPDCLRFKMKEIIIQNRKALMHKELTLILYLLKHSSQLERLRVNAHILDSQMRKQLLNFNRASGLCKIEFV